MDRFLLYRTFGELEVGQTQRTRGRTVTETDIVNWCALTGDWFYPHIDAVAAERSMFGKRVAPGIMVFAMAIFVGEWRYTLRRATLANGSTRKTRR